MYWTPKYLNVLDFVCLFGLNRVSTEDDTPRYSVVYFVNVSWNRVPEVLKSNLEDLGFDFPYESSR